MPMGTVTLPLASTWISEFLKAKSGLAAFTASRTAFFSASVKLFKSETSTGAFGSFNVLPVLSKGLTVSEPASFPVLPSSVTVTLPLASTVTTALSLSLPWLAFLTASATLSLSGSVKLLTSLTSTFSGLSSLIILLSSVIVFSEGTLPVLPPWSIVTFPFSSTVTSPGFKFRSGLAAIMASLTLPFSSSVKPSLFLTSIGFSGGLMLFKTSFCLTVFSAGISPVLPSFVTVTFPSLPTVMSSFVKPGLAAITASLTASFSPEVRSVLSKTGTGSFGAFNSNLLSDFCSQTAYTVFEPATLLKSVTSAVVASCVLAQPLKV